MNQFQKTMKYLAIAFAIFLTITIIYLIISSIGFVVNIFDFGDNWTSSNKNNSSNVNEKVFTYGEADLEKVYIDHGVGKLTIKPSLTDDLDDLSVIILGTEDYYRVSYSDKTLKVEDKTNDFFDIKLKKRLKQQVEVIIYLPKDHKLTDLDVQAGAGSIILEDFATENLNIKAGAGVISATKVMADYSNVDGGVGELNFKDVEFNSGDIDMGVGSLNFSGILQGRHTIDAGIGELNLDIKGDLEDYNLDIEKGLGEIKINGKRFKEIDFSQSQNGNDLDISGGIGSINIDFRE